MYWNLEIPEECQGIYSGDPITTVGVVPLLKVDNHPFILGCWDIASGSGLRDFRGSYLFE